jgi:hypothetical protein
MQRARLTRRAALAGGMASLLAATGKPPAQARAELVATAGGTAGSDLLVLQPDSPQFFGLTQGFNRRWAAPNCEVILLPLTEAGAQQALGKAIAFGRGNFRVRGGGHCYEDFVFSARTRALIDMSLLNASGFDARTGVFYAESGGTNWDLYRQLYWRFGRTLPAGSCYSVGLGGHICGGGYGLLSRQFGLTVDWLTGVNVVTVNQSGTVFTQATAQSGGPAQDLYWAHTGGGGGNFGLITRYEFDDLPLAPKYAELFTFSWKWADILNDPGLLTRIIEAFEQLTRTMPATVFLILKLQHQAAGEVALLVQSTHDGAGAFSLTGHLRSVLREHGVCDCAAAPQCALIGHPVNLACPLPYQNLRWIEAVQTLNGSGPNQKGKYKSAYMRKDFAAEQIQTIFTYLTRTPAGPAEKTNMAQSLLQVDSYSGRINTVDAQATAVWQRSSIMKLQYQTYWQDPDSGPDPDDPHIRWIREFYAAMYAGSGGIPDPEKDPTHNVDGCYINYPDMDLNDFGRDTALRLYYGGNLPRLKQAKAEWDPLDYFQNGQSIPLA